MAGTLLIVGAAGDVGQGIARVALAQDWTVVVAGRSRERLARSFGDPTDGRLHLCTGDVASEEGARALWHAAVAVAGPLDAVVVSVNSARHPAALAQWDEAELAALLHADLLTHFNVAKVMLPLLGDRGLLIGIGGGTADFVIPGLAPVSVAQAALRMLYRGFARERKAGAQIRELMIVSMVNGASKRDAAKPEWVTDEDVGRHICAILERPDGFPEPILQLSHRDQAGRLDRPSQGDSAV